MDSSDKHQHIDQDRWACEVFLGRLIPDLARKHVAGGVIPRLATGEVDHIMWADSLGLQVEPTFDAISALWPKLITAVHLGAALSAVFELRYGESRQSTLLSRLPLTRWACELAERGASPARALRRGWVEPVEIRTSRVSLKKAASLAGFRPMHLKFLMTKGLVVPSAIPCEGVRQYMFSMDQVSALRELRPSAFRDGSSLVVGMEGRARNVMRAANVVKTRVDVHGVTRFDESELRDLLDRLNRMALPANADQRWMTRLGSGRFWQRRFFPALRSVVDDLCAGRYPIYKTNDAAGLNALLVGTEVLSELRCRSRGQVPQESHDGGAQLGIDGMSDGAYNGRKVYRSPAFAQVSARRCFHDGNQLALFPTLDGQSVARDLAQPLEAS